MTEDQPQGRPGSPGPGRRRRPAPVRARAARRPAGRGPARTRSPRPTSPTDDEPEADGATSRAASDAATSPRRPPPRSRPPSPRRSRDRPKVAITRRRRRKDPLAAALIGVLTLLLGFAFAVQVRNVGNDQLLAGAREEDLVRILDDLNAREERLREQITDQRSALQQLSSSDSRSAAALEEARKRAEAIGILNGTVAAQGPGLTMTVRDPDDAVRVADILDAIQELRGAGAETMQIDGVRVGVSTAVTGNAGSLMVDGRPITTPVRVHRHRLPAEHGDGDEHPRRRGAAVHQSGGVGRHRPVRRGGRGRVAAARHASIRFPGHGRLKDPRARTLARTPTSPGDDRRMATPDDRRYTDQHEWALVQGTDGTADRRAGRHHRPRAGRARRHRLRPAPRGRGRGRPRARRSARWSPPSRCPTSTRRSPGWWPR